MLDQANQTRKLKIRYTVIDHPVYHADTVHYELIAGINPSLCPWYPTEVVTLDQFLRRPVAKISNTTVTILDVIQFFANTGAIHAGKPKSARQEAAGRFGLSFVDDEGNPTSGAAKVLVSIVGVFLSGIDPLKVRVFDDTRLSNKK